MKFQTFAAPSQNLVFNYALNVNQAQMKNVFSVLQDYANSTAMPAEMNMRVFINRSGVRLVVLRLKVKLRGKVLTVV
jgi:hypothetical protein